MCQAAQAQKRIGIKLHSLVQLVSHWKPTRYDAVIYQQVASTLFLVHAANVDWAQDNVVVFGPLCILV